MLKDLGMMVNDFELYCYSCACHPERLAKLLGRDDMHTHLRLLALLAHGKCPMMGRMACNFACGEWKSMFASIADKR